MKTKELSNNSKFDLIKDTINMLQNIATIAAIIAAGIWFFWQQESRPKAIIAHQVTHRKLPDDKTWVQLKIEVINVGKTQFSVNLANIWLQQILPLNNKIRYEIANGNLPDLSGRISWPLLQNEYCLNPRFIVMPNEKDYLCYDFIVPSKTKTVRLYTALHTVFNKYSTVLSQSTIYDLTESKKGESK